MENLLKFLSWEKQIRHKFSTAGYPMRFVNSMINDIESKEHDSMIPNYLFNDFESWFWIKSYCFNWYAIL